MARVQTSTSVKTGLGSRNELMKSQYAENLISDFDSKHHIREVEIESSGQLWDAKLDIGGMILSGGVTAPNGTEVTPDKFKAYAEFSLAFAFPVVSSYASAFHPSTVRNSFLSMLNQQFNYGHLLSNYYKKEDKDQREDRILGAIIGVSYPREPAGGWRLTSVENSPGMRCVATVAKQAKGMDRIIGKHATGRENWTVSLEVEYHLVDSGVVMIPNEERRMGALGGRGRETAITDEEMSVLAKHTPDDYKKAGLFYLPMIETTEEIIKCFSPEQGKFTKPWKGHNLVCMIGGLDGTVAFHGTGLVNFGAEPAATLHTLLASDNDSAALSAELSKLSAALDRLME
jgi:hypothetical protein